MADLVCTVPYRYVAGELQLLLITSRKKGSWIFPKGHVPNGESPLVTAAKEAWEEAGVQGTFQESPLSTFDQATEDGIQVTEVYLLRVEQVASKWPERKQRQRKWTCLEKVPKFLKKTHLRKLLGHLDEAAPIEA